MQNNTIKKGDKTEDPWVYLLVKGRSLDDEPRESLDKECASILAKYGITYVRDASAGLIPSNSIRDERECQGRRYITGTKSLEYQDTEEGVVNAFKVGRLKHPEKFDIKSIEPVMDDAMKYWEAGLSFVVLVTASPLHRHVHRNHDCIPSNVLALFNNKVLVESWLVDKKTLEIMHQPDEPKGTLFILDTPKPTPPPRPGHVRVHDWESRPAIASIPDGRSGVGGRTLIRSCALERMGYHGGELPSDIKDIDPKTMGFIEEKSPNSLPMLVMANKIEVISAVGGPGNNSLAVNLMLKNNTDEEIVVEVPAGSLFEVIDPKAAVQNLATAGGMSIRMGPRSTRSVMINAFCANHYFASPSNQPVRPTIFKMENPGRSQSDVWDDLDRRGRN